MLLTNIRQINEYQRGILFVMGKYKRVVNSGWTFIIPIFQSMKIVDVRTKTIDLADQGGMTADNVSVKIGAVVFFKIVDASRAVLEVENYQWAISQLAETTMRTAVGEVELNKLLSGRDEVANNIEAIIESKATDWGLHIIGVELKDIVLPDDMKRTMAKQAEAEREKLSVITKAEGELIAAENLSKAAEMMSKSPGALHLRTLSTLNDLSSDQSNTVIFAIPIEVLRAFEKVGSGSNLSLDDMATKISGMIKGATNK
ncbi:slipin family protein [Candidatus Nomurabacteria bacterium]|uniref:Slipin family protein n=1 Tax=Candidatus Dojkabacteria bacterium TaxID=2099670 RepID=A0A955I2C2_9BACT|nr:slipin family protein [Candidatus Dojkabacteria bacterium]MCB9790144.1 slipin family protein [Candidatus Nomurabacteria bacterium]MCB9803336.1 slipin family protein [Candidatus Nomurabacteria bacterium]